MKSIPRRFPRRGGAARFGWIGWCVVTLLVAAAPVASAPKVGPDTPLELVLRETPLGVAMNSLTLQTGVQILFVDPEGKLLARKVSLNVTAKNVEEAIRRICTAAQCYYRKDEDGVYEISLEPPKPKGSAHAPAEGMTATTAEALLPRNEVFEKIFLQYTDPRAMLQILMSNSFAVGQKPRPGSSVEELKELDIIPGIVDPTTGRYIPPPTYVDPNAARSLIAPGVNTGAGALLGSSLTAAGQFGGGFPGGGIGAPGGVGGIGAPGGIGGGLGAGVGGGLGAGLGAGVGGTGLLPQGISGVLAYPLDNSLLVRGDADAITDLKQVIRLLDIPPKQIQIKVEQIRIETNVQKALGIDWDVVTNDFAASSLLGQSTGGSINIAYASGNFRARLAALLTQGKATIIDSATVSTMNNVPAIIQTLSVSWVFLPQRQQIQGAGLVTVFVPQPIAIPTSLIATPRVNADGSVTMLIPFTISRPSGESVSPDGQRIPNQISTQLFVLRRVPSGGTVVLGAISNKDDSQSENRIPLLSELPIIGNLFRSRLNRKNDQETLFFFTPTVLPDLPGTSEAAP